MVDGIEFLMSVHKPGRPMGQALLAAARTVGIEAAQPHKDVYGGRHRILMIYGIGDPRMAEARTRHIAAGGVVVLWDIGYFHRKLMTKEYMRVSINTDHPPAIMELAPDVPSRWNQLGLELTDDHDPGGPIVLVGLGWKSRAYLGVEGIGWEERKYRELRERFPGRKIVHRPKPNPRYPFPNLGCAVREGGKIDDVIRGASLVICRHSNVTVDAVRMGVPFECQDGAARYLVGKPYTRENRLAFLRRLAWWQWKPSEALNALSFVTDAVDRMTKRAGVLA